MSDQVFFPSVVAPIEYEGPSSKNPLAFKWYDADKVVMGKTMRDHLRFSVAYWHTWRGGGSDMFGGPVYSRSWEDEKADPLEMAVKRMKVNFEFLQKLGCGYYCFHDRDIAPKGATLTESEHNLDVVARAAKQLQGETGIKVLWGTSNLFSDPLYMNGAATNPDSRVFAFAAAQVKKCMEVSQDLGAENFVFWGGREGYQTLLNTNMKTDLDNYAKFLRFACDYKKKLGFNAQLLIEPKPREPTKHQYDTDVATCTAFLKTYGLDNDYKLNIEANHAILAGHSFEHEVRLASTYGLLGSIDANAGDYLLGWDTDQFNMDHKDTTMVMKVILEQGGLGSGGLNFDAKLRRESTDVEDIFIGHIGGMDTFARGLVTAAKIIEEGDLDGLVKDRYKSYENDTLGISAGTASFESLSKWAHEQTSEPPQISGKQERYEMLLNYYV